jgi:hypothetical protein
VRTKTKNGAGDIKRFSKTRSGMHATPLSKVAPPPLAMQPLRDRPVF